MFFILFLNHKKIKIVSQLSRQLGKNFRCKIVSSNLIVSLFICYFYSKSNVDSFCFLIFFSFFYLGFFIIFFTLVIFKSQRYEKNLNISKFPKSDKIKKNQVSHCKNLENYQIETTITQLYTQSITIFLLIKK